MNHISAKVKDIINKAYRKKVVNSSEKLQISNKNISIISNNCNGGVLAHDLNLGFNSPFVNLWIYPDEYLKLLKNLKYYMGCELQFISEEGIEYPIGILDDVRIYFQHYSSQEEARSAWERRKERINYDNLVVLFADRDGCTEKNILEFDGLQYDRKVVFTHKPYPNVNSAYFFKDFENNTEVGVLSQFKKGKIGVRYFDEYDFHSLIDRA